MATISNNEIKIKYSLDTTDLANATALFDRLSAEDRQLINDLKKLQGQLQQTGQAGQTAGRQIGDSLRNTQKDTGVLIDTVGQLRSVVIGAFSVQAIISFGKAVLDTTVKMEGLRKAIEFTSGSLVAGAANFEFLKKTADEFGIPLAAAAEGFKTFSAAANRSSIPMGTVRDMFMQLSTAMAALNVTAQDAQLIFFGVGQMLSKPKVSAQELYHQIGERLPIAMQAAEIAAAKLTGQTKVTSGELIKLVEDGKLLSSEFAPAFLEALGKLGESGAYVETLGKSLNRLGNAWEELKTRIGESRAIVGAVNILKDWIQTVDMAVEVISYYKDFSFLIPGNTKQSLVEFKESQRLIQQGFNDIVEWAKKRDDELERLNAEYQKTLTDETEAGEAARIGIEKKYAEERKTIVSEITNGIKTRETEIINLRQQIADKQKEIDDKYLKTGYVKQLEKDIQFIERKIKGNLAQIDALKKSLGTLPEISKPTPDEGKAKQKVKEETDKYRELINAIEAAKIAEDNRIKARTIPGDLRDIELLKNNIKFNKEMLKIDEDARFKELELAKNNAVKRKGENERDLAEQEKIRIAAYERALKAEKEYIDKANKEIAAGQTERRRMLQTEFDNEIADSQARQQQRIDEAVIGANKALKEQALSDEQRKGIAKNLQDTLTNIEREGQEERLAIEKYYARRAIYETKISVIDSNKIINEANRIRAVALTTDLEKISDINRDAALNDIQLEKDKIQEQMKLNAEATEAFVGETANKNRLLLAQLKLLEAQEVDIVKRAEQEKLNLRAAALQNYLSQIQAVMNAAFDLYSRNLNNEMVLMNRRYDEEIRLADGNKQKITEIEEKRRAKEKEIRLKQFRAEQVQAIANIWFAAAPQIVANTLNPILQGVIIGSALAQSAIVMMQPVPEFAEGTKGKPFKGGKAIVGERGVEKVVTESGKVYFTPPTATLIDLPKGSQVIPNHALNKQELFLASQYANKTSSVSSSPMIGKLDEIGGILKGLPITQLNMDERGFEKFIRTPRRTTKVLNNRFGIKA